MDSKKVRMLVNGGLYSFVALVLFFCYAIISDTSEISPGAAGMVAVGYFFGLIAIAAYSVLRVCPIQRIKDLASPSTDLGFAVAFVISIVFSVFGYWGLATDYGITEFAAYCVGFSFFLALTGAQLAIDFRTTGQVVFGKEGI